jgi:hypothetical protein
MTPHVLRAIAYRQLGDCRPNLINASCSFVAASTGNLKTLLCLFADTDLAKAVQHALTVSREGQCRVPKPRLIQVKDVYPHPSKTYIPHCTILHLCGDDTGCCKSDTLTCIARKTEQVDLYFYVS